MDAQPAGRNAALPWLILVRPVAAWTQAGAQPVWLQAILAQWLLAALGWLLSAQPRLELSQAAGVASATQAFTAGGMAGGLALQLIPVALRISLLAAAGGLALLLCGWRVPWTRLCSWAGLALMPLALGGVLADVLLFFVRPLADSPRQALAIELRAFPLGPSLLLPQLFPPLSPQWFIASYFDGFALWGLALAALGIVRYLGLPLRRTAWALSALVLILLLALTAVWSITQGTV
jgi:hypothetical protein